MKTLISILGSTGSVGESVFKIIDKKKNKFKVNVLSANKNFFTIDNQIKKYKPNYFIISDQMIFEKIRKKYKKKKIKILNKLKNINNFNKSDITISAIPGIAGLEPTIIMLKFSKNSNCK